MPCPPPMHSEATPYFSCWRRSSYISVMVRRAPLAARGWPIEIPPPFTFVLSRFKHTFIDVGLQRELPFPHYEARCQDWTHARSVAGPMLHIRLYLSCAGAPLPARGPSIRRRHW